MTERERKLEAALRELIEEYEGLLDYVDNHTRAKWGYDEVPAKARAALSLPESPVSESEMWKQWEKLKLTVVDAWCADDVIAAERDVDAFVHSLIEGQQQTEQAMKEMRNAGIMDEFRSPADALRQMDLYIHEAEQAAARWLDDTYGWSLAMCFDELGKRWSAEIDARIGAGQQNVGESEREDTARMDFIEASECRINKTVANTVELLPNEAGSVLTFGGNNVREAIDNARTFVATRIQSSTAPQLLLAEGATSRKLGVVGTAPLTQEVQP